MEMSEGFTTVRSDRNTQDPGLNGDYTVGFYMEGDEPVQLERADSPQMQPAFCPDCTSIADDANAHTLCASCELRTVAPSNPYSGATSELIVHGADAIPATAHAPKVKRHNKRRHPRVILRHARALVESKDVSTVGEVLNVSCSGMSFATDEMWFPLFAPVLIAVHYIEGGHNIFQKGHIVRVRARPVDPSVEYGVEFAE